MIFDPRDAHGGPDLYLALKKEKKMTNNLTLGRIDFAPLTRLTVGFDEMFSDFAKITSTSQNETNYPPYNIIKYNDESYAIELAVAGFDLSDIDINVEGSHLNVSGARPEKATVNTNYIHRGISARDFSRTFALGNYIEVTGASMKNGMLTIRLTRVLPETMKPRKISITKDTGK